MTVDVVQVLVWAVLGLLGIVGTLGGLYVRSQVGRISDHEERLRKLEGRAPGKSREQCDAIHATLCDGLRREFSGAERAHGDIVAALGVAKQAVRLLEREPREDDE